MSKSNQGIDRWDKWDRPISQVHRDDLFSTSRDDNTNMIEVLHMGHSTITFWSHVDSTITLKIINLLELFNIKVYISGSICFENNYAHFLSS